MDKEKEEQRKKKDAKEMVRQTAGDGNEERKQPAYVKLGQEVRD